MSKYLAYFPVQGVFRALGTDVTSTTTTNKVIEPHQNAVYKLDNILVVSAIEPCDACIKFANTR
jgi:hypothetical protein